MQFKSKNIHSYRYKSREHNVQKHTLLGDIRITEYTSYVWR